MFWFLLGLMILWYLTLLVAAAVAFAVWLLHRLVMVCWPR